MLPHAFVTPPMLCPTMKCLASSTHSRASWKTLFSRGEFGSAVSLLWLRTSRRVAALLEKDGKERRSC